MLLSIVIPSRNPDSWFLMGVSALIKSRPDWQVIVVDDSSDTDLRALLPSASNLTVLRNSQQLGAGFSRNVGIGEIRGEYAVFLDDDDYPNWDVIGELISLMDSEPAADVAISSYRVMENGRIRSAHDRDMRILEEALGGQRTRVIGLDGNESLLRLTNFPWTKVYRTDFIRRIDLRFSETWVQNDVFAHWQSLLGATRILVSSLPQVTHTVSAKGNRIRNIADERRLDLFVAMRETYELVNGSDLPRAHTLFWAFYAELIRWAVGVLSPTQRTSFLREHISFAGVIPPWELDIEAVTGMKRWEIWEMSLVEMVGPASDEEPDPEGMIAQSEIFLAEISRLKRLAKELVEENDRLRVQLRHQTGECDRMQRECDRMQRECDRMQRECDRMQLEVNSKAAQLGFRLRNAYHKVTRNRKEFSG